MRYAVVAFTLSIALGCGSPATPGSCTTADDCARGDQCIDGTCRARADSGPSRIDAGNPIDAGPGRDAGPPCVPTETDETTCNLADDDCNGFIDDVDVGGDGLCDCLSIGVIGEPGTLASSSFQAWLEARGTSVVRFGLDATPLTAGALAAHDVVILDRLTREYTADEAALLYAYVEGGGGVMSMTGYTGGGEDRLRPNSLLAAIGISYVAELRNGPVTSFATHPLTQGLTSVTFAGGYRVTGAGVAVAHLADGDAAIALELGNGRVYVWGDEWVQFDSEWSTMPEIAQFWVNAIQWLGPRDRCVVLF